MTSPTTVMLTHQNITGSTFLLTRAGEEPIEWNSNNFFVTRKGIQYSVIKPLNRPCHDSYENDYLGYLKPLDFKVQVKEGKEEVLICFRDEEDRYCS